MVRSDTPESTGVYHPLQQLVSQFDSLPNLAPVARNVVQLAVVRSAKLSLEVATLRLMDWVRTRVDTRTRTELELLKGQIEHLTNQLSEVEERMKRSEERVRESERVISEMEATIRTHESKAHAVSSQIVDGDATGEQKEELEKCVGALEEGQQALREAESAKEKEQDEERRRREEHDAIQQQVKSLQERLQSVSRGTRSRSVASSSSDGGGGATMGNEERRSLRSTGKGVAAC